MKGNPENIDALVAAYLQGDASPEEAMAVDAWRFAQSENEKHFGHVCALYGKNPELYSWNVNAAWNKVKPHTEKSAPVIPLWTVFKVAAGLALLTVVGVVMYNLLESEQVSYQAKAGNELLVDTLPGQHVVALNSGSAVQYDLKGSLENIRLEGDAWFDLNSKADITTTVSTQGLQIRDIGTSFGVSTLGDSTTVFVTEGSVQLFTEANPGLLLTAGQAAVYVAGVGSITPIPTPASETYEWHDRKFYFNGARLSEVVRRLNAAYAVRFVLSGPVENCRITASFYNENPHTIAEVLAETLGLTIQLQTGEIILSGENCNN